MKTRNIFVVGVLLAAMSFAVNANNSGGEGNNTGCNGQGNQNSPCEGTTGTPGTHGNGGNGGNGGSGGIGVGVGIGVANAEANAVALTEVRNTNQNANINNVNVQNSVNNTATGGNATANVGDVSATGGNATATGGEGGSAVSAAVVESGAVSVAEGAFQNSTVYKEVQQAPSIGQGSFAITGCSVAGNAGGSGPGWSGFLGFGFTPQQCYDFMLAQAYQSIGEKKAVCDILKNSKAGKRQEKRGVVLPECTPEVKTVVVPAPVDLSPYATKEELNRAFKASQSK